VCLTKFPGVQYLQSSSLDLLRLLHDVSAAGIEFAALDRCPRCATFMCTHIDSLKAPGDLLTLRAVVKATELARLDLYMSYALAKARTGLFPIARQVAFETVAHVSPADPRPHLLLGQLALVFGDDRLLAEAKAFLLLMKFDAWARTLEQDEKSGSLDFAQPEFFSKLQQ